MSVLHLSVVTKGSEYPYQGRYLSTLTLAQLKSKLELIVGIISQNIKIQLHTAEDKFVAELTDDTKTLEEFNVMDKANLHVSDVTNSQVNFNTSSDVNDRYVIENEKYESRENSVRKWMKELGVDKQEVIIPDYVKVGKRCVVVMPNQPPKEGVVAFTGKTHFKEGNWVGVIYDKAVGKNDGYVSGQRYFTCSPNCGGFVSPKYVFSITEKPNETVSPEIEEI